MQKKAQFVKTVDQIGYKDYPCPDGSPQLPAYNSGTSKVAEATSSDLSPDHLHRANSEVQNFPSPLPSEMSNSSLKDEVKSSAQLNLTSISSLTSLSEERDRRLQCSLSPGEGLNFLKSVHRRVKRRRQLRSFLWLLHFIIVYCLPPIGVLLGTVGICVGYFLRQQQSLVSGCLLLIVAMGFSLQACFWERSAPNKFKAAEIAFNMAQQEETPQYPASLQPPSDQSRETTLLEKGEPPNVLTVSPARMRRLSIALNRATEELSAARRLNETGDRGVMDFARRLTMAPGLGYQVGEFATSSRDVESSSGWIAGRIPGGVRRSLAWNTSGAGRFYASNYD